MSQDPNERPYNPVKPKVGHSPELSTEDVAERLNGINIPTQTKVEFFLVYLGEKPATHFHAPATKRVPGEPPRVYDQSAYDASVAWAQDAGVVHAAETNTINPAAMPFVGREGEMLRADLAGTSRLAEAEAYMAAGIEEDRLSLYLAKDEVWLEKMKHAVEENDPELYGESVGFPTSAIDAYASRTAQSPQNFQTLLNDDTAAFASFVLSPEHTAAELQTVQRWADAIHGHNPELYERVMATAHGRMNP